MKNNVKMVFDEASVDSIESELKTLSSMNFDSFSFDFKDAANLGEVEFQFPYRLKEIKDTIVKKTTPTKPFSSPVKPFKERSEHASPQKTASSPVKAQQTLFVATDFSLRQNENNGLEQNLLKSLSIEHALSRISAIESNIQALLVRFEGILQVEKERSKKLFMEHTQHRDEEVLDDLFDLIHKNNGVFEEVARTLTLERLQAPAKSIAENRNKIIANKELFQNLGSVDIEPKNYFELTHTSDQLARVFIERLYQSPKQLEVMLQFQQAKEKGMRFNFLNTILKISAESLCNKSFLYRINPETQERVYIRSVSEEENLSNILLDTKEEMRLKVNSRLVKNGLTKSAEEINEAVDLIHRKFHGATTAKTCISFFPIRIEHIDSAQPEYICLVTTSGELQKLDKQTPNNIKALKDFQDMLQSFIKENFVSKTMDGVSYKFKYHAEEKEFIDLALQQINKGLSGEEQPLSTHNEKHASLLIKPLRACAEKKFIAYVRELLVTDKHIKSFKIMGAANLNMPVLSMPEESINASTQVEPKKQAYAGKKAAVPQDPFLVTHQGLWLEFYTQLLHVAQSSENDFAELTDLLTSLESPNHSIKKNLENFTVVENRKIVEREITDCAKKIRRAIVVAGKKNEKKLTPQFLQECQLQLNKLQAAIVPTHKGPTDIFTFTTPYSKKDLSTKFIPCCAGCQAAKLPVLTMLSHFLPLYKKEIILPVAKPGLSPRSLPQSDTIMSTIVDSPLLDDLRVHLAASNLLDRDDKQSSKPLSPVVNPAVRKGLSFLS